MFISLLVLLASQWGFSSVHVAYLHKESKSYFDEKIKPAFESYKNCKDCELVDFTPYNEKGEFDESSFLKQISSIDSKYQMVFCDWNEKVSDKNKSVVDLLNKKSSEGLLMMFSAGYAPKSEPTVLLNKTVAGLVSESIIVGEMTDRERLLPELFFGPEMLTAVKPPRDFVGKGVGPVFFLTRWMSRWEKRQATEWVAYLKMKKFKSKKIWMAPEDFFP